jgi:hypothetical protein
LIDKLNLVTHLVMILLSSLSRLLKNAHLLRFPHFSSLRRTSKYASGHLTVSAAWQESLLFRRDATLGISGALHLSIFEQPDK